MKDIVEKDSREAFEEDGLRPKGFDDLLLGMERTGRGVQAIKTSGIASIVVIVALLFYSGVRFSDFMGQWQQMRSDMQDMRLEIARNKSSSDTHNATVDNILAMQVTTNALLSQRIDQREKVDDRLESRFGK